MRTLVVATALLLSTLASGAVVVEKTAYKGWPNCYRISNGTVELIVTTDVGPRIIRYAFVGAENEFFEDPSQVGKTGGNEWRAYGGHRLWHAPEAIPRTYWPDNVPVMTDHGALYGLRLTQNVEGTTGIQKEIEVRLADQGTRVQVIHHLRNVGQWPVELAPWALTVMAPGGAAVIPLPARGTHPKDLLPTSRISIWPYSDLSDPRWKLGQRYVLFRQDSKATTPQKLGFFVPDGWAAYSHGDHLFLKKFASQTDAHYPDFGMNVESFTNASMLELETLGPLVRLAPGASTEHTEYWFLFRGVRLDPQSDDGVIRNILPKVKEALLP